MRSAAANPGAIPGAATPHVAALDGVRAIAILLVIPHNVDVLTGALNPLEYPAKLFMHTGWIGVQLFFVLSGFLITGNLLDTRRADNYFSAFFGRRALRILPLYFAVLIAAFVIAPLLALPLGPTHANASQQLALWTFLSNWTQPYWGSADGFGHFWSLAVEEQFYLLWPLAVWSASPRRLLAVCAAATVGALATRAALAAAQFPHEALYMFTPCRMDALALGAAAAALLRIPQAHAWLCRSTRGIALAAVTMLVAVAAGTDLFAVYDPASQLFGYTFLALAFALSVLLAVLPTRGILARALRPLSFAPLRLIGRYSYGMYVFHLPLHVFVGLPLLHRLMPQITPAAAIVYAAAMTIASFAVAALSYELFERHFLRLKSRLAYKILPPSKAIGTES